MAETSAETYGSGQMAATISRLAVHTFADFTGRGPVKVRTSIDTNSIHIVLHDLLSTTERNLVLSGHTETVLGLRRAVQDGIGPILIEGVEATTGRTVAAFLSVNHVAPDVCVESFILEPVQ